MFILFEIFLINLNHLKQDFRGIPNRRKTTHIPERAFVTCVSMVTINSWRSSDVLCRRLKSLRLHWQSFNHSIIQSLQSTDCFPSIERKNEVSSTFCQWMDELIKETWELEIVFFIVRTEENLADSLRMGWEAINQVALCRSVSSLSVPCVTMTVLTGYKQLKHY